MEPSHTRSLRLSVVAGVRRRRAARWVGAFGAMASLPLLAGSLDPVAYGGLGLSATVAMVLARAVRRHEGTLELDEGRIVWRPTHGAAWEQPREALVAGWHEPAGEGHRVVLQFERGDELDVTVDGAATARNLLALAGVGAAQRAMVFETRSAWARFAWFFGAFVMGFTALMLALVTLFSFMVFPWAGVVMLLPLATTALLTVVMLRPVDTMEVLVGIDGITARGELDDRFIPYSDVEAVRDEPRGLVLTLADGSEVLVQGSTIGAWRRRAVCERIRDALAARRAAEATARTSELLARGDMPFEAWREALASRTRLERVYRDQSLGRGELCDVLADATAPPQQRAAAAMVLTAIESRSDEALTRVRVAAESSASDPLRCALERVLDDALDERAWKRLERAGRSRG